jgi:LysM repeat protein
VISEREKLEFDSLPEFIREPYSSVRESYIPPAPPKNYSPTPPPAPKSYSRDAEWDEPVAPKSAALEALWPGVNQDFLHDSKKSPSFYLTLGFMAGAVISLIGVWGYSIVSHTVIAANDSSKKIVVAGQPSESGTAGAAAAATPTTTNVGGSEVVTPAYAEWEVKTGDTLAAIALSAYKRVSPRLLDEICKANNMRSANVLSLGQKLVLPQYRPQTSIAGQGQIQ